METELINDALACVNLLVRMKVFPERDGNAQRPAGYPNLSQFRPNEGLP